MRPSDLDLLCLDLEMITPDTSAMINLCTTSKLPILFQY